MQACWEPLSTCSPGTGLSRADSPSLTGAALLPPSSPSVLLASEQEVPKGDSQEAVPSFSLLRASCLGKLAYPVPRGMSPLGMVPTYPGKQKQRPCWAYNSPTHDSLECLRSKSAQLQTCSLLGSLAPKSHSGPHLPQVVPPSAVSDYPRHTSQFPFLMRHSFWRTMHIT